jgi:hypothetical protein
MVHSAKVGIVQAPLGDLIEQALNSPPEYTTFFRLDAQDYVIVWEQSGEYERLRSAGERAPYTAILGFGTDRFDPEFGSDLLRRTGTREISNLAESIWKELGFLGVEFKQGRIDPARSYND